VAKVKAQIAQAEAELANAKLGTQPDHLLWPANGTVIALTLRPGAMATPMPTIPAMNFVEDEQWLLAIYHQNEVRQDSAGPGGGGRLQDVSRPDRQMQGRLHHVGHRQGQLPIGSMNPAGGVAPIPPTVLAVRLLPGQQGQGHLPGRRRQGCRRVYSDSGVAIQILRRILVRISAKLDWLILKMH